MKERRCIRTACLSTTGVESAPCGGFTSAGERAHWLSDVTFFFSSTSKARVGIGGSVRFVMMNVCVCVCVCVCVKRMFFLLYVFTSKLTSHEGYQRLHRRSDL